MTSLVLSLTTPGSLCLSSGGSLVLGCTPQIELDVAHSWVLTGTQETVDVGHSWIINGTLNVDVTHSWALAASLIAEDGRVFYILR